MNAHRQELKTNELANFLGHQVDHYRSYTKPVLGTVLALMVLVVIYQYSQQRSAQRDATLWGEYVAAVNTGETTELKVLAEKNPNTAPGGWAAVMLGDMKFGRAMNDVSNNRPEFNSQLQDAKKAYEDALKATDPEIQRRATLGLAKTLESLGELPKARERYEDVVKKWPGTVYATLASDRLKALDRMPVKEFYDWLAARPATPPASSTPGIPGLRPGSLDELDKARSDFEFGTPLKPSTSSTETSPPAGTTTTTPPADATKSPDSK